MLTKVEITGVKHLKITSANKYRKNELLEKNKNGDAEARETFINGNLKISIKYYTKNEFKRRKFR